MLLPAADRVTETPLAAPAPVRDETLVRLAAPVAEALAMTEQRLLELVPEGLAGPVPVIYRQMLQAGGKRLRPMLTLLSCAAAGGDSLRAVGLGVAVEVLHLASLIHDDVIDEAEQRRGRPAARQEWGNKTAVLVGDFLVAEVFHRLADDVQRSSLSLLTRTVVEMCQAELLHCAPEPEPDESAYRRNIRGKTAALVATVCEAGAVAAENEAARPALREFGRKLGEAFQVSDDLLDLYGEARTVGKPVLQDLRKGQWTLAIIHALGQGTAAQQARLRELLAAARADVTAAREAADLAESLGGREYAEHVALDLANEAQAILEPFPPSEARRSLIELTAYVVRRRS